MPIECTEQALASTSIPVQTGLEQGIPRRGVFLNSTDPNGERIELVPLTDPSWFGKVH